MTLTPPPPPVTIDDQSWEGMVVIVSGTSWDDTWLSEKHLALQMSRRVPVLYVDPPVSWLTPLRKPQLSSSVTGPRLRLVRPNLARLTPLSPPGISRPVLRDVANAATRAAIRRGVTRLGGRVHALVVGSLDPFLDACPADLKVLYGTDDWVAGGSLMGISPSWLARREDDQLRRADLVVAVSTTLADRWSSRSRHVSVIANGCDAEAFASSDDVPAAAEVHLPQPIAGFLGHMSARIDLTMLDAVAATGLSLLLVGSRQLTFNLAHMEALLARDNVQWVGPRPFESLPTYMRHVTVGLTPYVDSAFNRSSFPLKTLEYLAAGRPAVVSDLPSARSLPAELVALCADAPAFAAAAVEAAAAAPDPELVRRRKTFAAEHSWAARADDFARLIGLPERSST
ncbi:MAG: glycosyltransferase family 1 protein [Cellulomonas sp.]|uniref:glycosyltransferase n=1 Tax=Cellulomonas sp. TaxID=40001 RepID=UPI0017B11C1D|nr:glycosyltransferase [Cellulomonas sp.]NMM16938.1 glycosyltransferase family 1 protein [Cellulomonas sp.]NMM30776.1 glycosyltransferase family 1 protein [Cellulomonas sp.]